MGFDIDISVPAATVFLQGLLSFFSPCVLPLIPLYMSYLSGKTGAGEEDGGVAFHRRKVMLHTFFFVIGVSFAFFALGLSMSAIGSFFHNNRMLLARVGGILIVLFGLYQLGIFGESNLLGKERRLPFKLDGAAMSPFMAFVMGFTFSFAWTPCVGPTLASVLLMMTSAKTQSQGFLLIGIYTLGFIIPFLAVGLFTTSLLALFRKYRSIVKYTVKVGGVLLIVMGVIMFTGKMNEITGYLSQISISDIRNGGEEKAGEDREEGADIDGKAEAEEGADINEEAAPEVYKAVDFTLTDQFGQEHSLKDYEGKTIFLNFWGTWCPPCRAEMPDIQAIYEGYQQEGEEALIVLGVVAPELGRETTVEEITEFLEENGYTYPTLMDTEWELFQAYGITSYPTTFMIDRDGNIFGYAAGQLSEDIMHSIIQQTMEGR